MDGNSGASGGGVDQPDLPGAFWNAKERQWTSRIEHRGKTVDLGLFETAEDAHEAYLMAKSAISGNMGSKQKPPVRRVKGFEGVLFDRHSKRYEAVVFAPDGTEVSGGDFDSAEEAARAHDALAKMYHGEDATVNYPEADYGGWVPPNTIERRQVVEVLKGQQLTAEEVLLLLTEERAIDPRVIDLQGNISMTQHVAFATGRNPAHMRRIADAVVKEVLKREVVPDPQMGPWLVEGRDCDDWMVVDLGSVVVNVFDERARAYYDLETRYERASQGLPPDSDDEESEEDLGDWESDSDEGAAKGRTKRRRERPGKQLTKREQEEREEAAMADWVARNPLPDDLVERLEADEMELATEARKQRR